MFSPTEYLTQLNQISLLNQIHNLGRPSQIPVVTAVPAIGYSGGECNDLIQAVALSPLTIGIAGAVAGALLLTHLVRKHGPAVLQWFRQHAQQFIASIKAKIKRQRATQLLPGTHSVVMA